MSIKNYSELIKYKTYSDRLQYLMLFGDVGEQTFSGARLLNQVFYKSQEWLEVRRDVIVRDCGFDLGIDGVEIFGKILIHHINPITKLDILNRDPKLLSMENLVTVSKKTHDFIHYGNKNDINNLNNNIFIRENGDTKLW